MSIVRLASAIPGAVTLQIDCPKVKNALGPDDLTRLYDALVECQNDPTIGVVVLTGAGDAFCAGADINYLNSLSGAKLANYLECWTELLTRIISMPKIVVAAVNGSTAGAGNHMVICADLALVRQGAKFHFTGAAKGIPSMELGSLLLPMTVGLKRAKSIYLRGGTVSAERAVEDGLCNELVAADDWGAAIDRLAGEFSGRSLSVIAHNKYVLNQQAFQMLGALKLSTLAGGFYLSNTSSLVTGRLPPKVP